MLPGVLQTLAQLADAGVRQTVVTGNIETVGMLKLQGGQLIPPIDPALGGFGDHGRDRVEVAERALERLAAAGWVRALDQCWIVGDTPRDLLCARDARRPLRPGGDRPALDGVHGRLGADVVIAGFEESTS